MNLLGPESVVGQQLRRRSPLRRMPVGVPPQTWRDARPAQIDRALQVALGRETGGWWVVGASADVPRDRTITRTIAGREVVLWRREGGDLVAGPGACPHLGALLDDCPVLAGVAHCRWHGLALAPAGGAGWQPWPALDDGVLVWVRLPAATTRPTPAPALPTRPDPTGSISAVVSVLARCEPRDIIANRLDPWHGAWFHPYAFSHLQVDAVDSSDERLVLEVAYRVAGSWAVPVVASFHCPDARTIVMTIESGEGVGSVVETHATAIGTDGFGEPLTMMTEVTIATSQRSGFAVARRLTSLIQPAMRRSARRLWQDDLVYAERLYELRRAAIATP